MAKTTHLHLKLSKTMIEALAKPNEYHWQVSIIVEFKSLKKKKSNLKVNTTSIN